MQKIKNNYHTYSPDILIQGKGVSYGSKSLWYRQVGDEYGNTPITAKFRSNGWDKTFEYEVIFNGSNKAYRPTDPIPQFSLRLNRVAGDGSVVFSQNIVDITTDCDVRHCPFCNKTVMFNSSNKLWTCSNISCQFKYSADTCELMYNEFKNLDDNRGSRRMFTSFESLSRLGKTGDMHIKRKNYNE
jgi:ribosomal protein L37AE/L43A